MTMGGIERITTVIGEIYDASINPSAWQHALESINAFAGGHASGIFSKDTISKSGITHYYCGADPHYIQLYADLYSRFDPLGILPPRGRVTAIPDLVSYDEYRRGPFYSGWLRPQGCADALNVVLNTAGFGKATLFTALPGKARMVDDEMRRRVQILVPHLSRALLIGDAIEVKRDQATAFAGALNGFKAAIFLTDAGGRVVHANSAGQSMLGTGNVLRLNGGRLAACDAKAAPILRELLSRDLDSQEQEIALPMNSDAFEHYVVQRVRLSPSVKRGLCAPNTAAAAIFVRKAAIDSRPPANLIARTYRLTPTELRVLLAIIDVGGIPEVAQYLGIAETTVKTHLHRIFSKTGTNRQADLVRLAASYSGSFGN
jgi:DNA-binding CsgD family transcriptional regulator/PAS domain-containing protein